MQRWVISRREFIRGAGATGLVSSLAPVTIIALSQDAGVSGTQFQVEDPEGLLARMQAPVSAEITLSEQFRRAAAEGRLVLREKSGNPDNRQIYVQSLSAPVGEATRLCWLMPAGSAGIRAFELDTISPASPRIFARQTDGQYEIHEGGKPLLRYNYEKVEPGALLNSISTDNRKYAVPRSNYIHPLYGLHGEILTKDWSVDHPHHRGIYWAWPEVDYQGERGDLHALQKVFARPAGRCDMLSGAVFSQVKAENVWMWEDREPIVREYATIRVYAQAAPENLRPGSSSIAVPKPARVVDLEFSFEALKDPVLLARRGTSHYGGLNIRLNAVREQRITKSAGLGAPASLPAKQSAGTLGPPASLPAELEVIKARKAWADLSGTFGSSPSPSGLMIIQHAHNPDYPGDWLEYPELNWLQPTFPASGNRYAINPGKPLRLRFRLVIHPGGAPSEQSGNDNWAAANSPNSSLAS